MSANRQTAKWTDCLDTKRSSFIWSLTRSSLNSHSFICPFPPLAPGPGCWRGVDDGWPHSKQLTTSQRVQTLRKGWGLNQTHTNKPGNSHTQNCHSTDKWHHSQESTERQRYAVTSRYCQHQRVECVHAITHSRWTPSVLLMSASSSHWGNIFITTNWAFLQRSIFSTLACCNTGL